MDRLLSQDLPPTLSDSGAYKADTAPPLTATGEPEHAGSPKTTLPAPATPPDQEAPKSRKKRKPRPRPAQAQAPVSVGSWFVTLMCMNIPVIGWIYLIILACSRSAGAKKGFAKAYLLYKFIFLLITLAILAVAVHYGLEVLDKVLAYMEML